MKKTILALALAAGLTSFAGSAKAQNDVTFTNPLSSYNIYLEFDGANWTIFNNGSMPVSVSTPTGTNYSSRDASGITIAAVSNVNPYIFIGSSISQTPLALLSGGGVNSYGAKSSQYTSIKTTGSIHLSGSAIPNNAQYQTIAYSLGGLNYYYGWLEFTDNSNASQIQLVAAYMDTNANEAITVGVSHNSDGPVAYGSTAVPEPSTYALFGIGAIGLLMVMRRKKAA
jgi:hypothetical protein